MLPLAIILGLLALAGLFLLLTGWRVVRPGTLGVKFSMGQVVRERVEPGVYFVLPWQRISSVLGKDYLVVPANQAWPLYDKGEFKGVLDSGIHTLLPGQEVQSAEGQGWIYVNPAQHAICMRYGKPVNDKRPHRVGGQVVTEAVDLEAKAAQEVVMDDIAAARTLPTGLYVLGPGEQINRISSRDECMEVPFDNLSLKDAIQVRGKALFTYRIEDPVKALLKVDNIELAMREQVLSILRQEMQHYKGFDDHVRAQDGSAAHEEFMAHNSEIITKVTEACQQVFGGRWGVEVVRLSLEEFSFVDPSIQQGIQQAATARAQAESSLITAEAKVKQTRMQAEADAIRQKVEAEACAECLRIEAAARADADRAKGAGYHDMVEAMGVDPALPMQLEALGKVADSTQFIQTSPDGSGIGALLAAASITRSAGGGSVKSGVQVSA